MEPDVEKERLVRLALVVEPGDGFIRKDLAGVTFDLSNAFAVAIEVGGILVARTGVVVRGEPVVEAVIVERGFVATSERSADVPFAEMRGLIAVVLEMLGDGDFAL